MDTVLAAGERGLTARAEDEQGTPARGVRELRATVGALVLALGRTVPGLMRAESTPVSIAPRCQGSMYRGRPSPTARRRRITARIRHAAEAPVHQKKMHRLLTLHQGQWQRRPQGHRPRAQRWVSRASRSNERWAIDTTHLLSGCDGWCHLTAVIDCPDRPIVGWRLALRRRRIGLTTPGLVLRSDNGLVFRTTACVKVAWRYALTQEYITRPSPQQHRMIARFFLTLQQACVWLHRVERRDHALPVAADGLDHAGADRPRSALRYWTPKEYAST